MSRLEQNKSVVRQYARLFSAGDFENLLDLFTPEAQIQGVLGFGHIRHVALPIWQDLHHAYHLQLQIEDLIAEGDLVAARFLETGTFTNPFRGTPPTGKTYSITAMEFFRFDGPKIAHRWGARDSASVARQLST